MTKTMTPRERIREGKVRRSLRRITFSQKPERTKTKRTTYAAKTPDGKFLFCQTKIDHTGNNVFMGMYEHDGIWQECGVFNRPHAHSGATVWASAFIVPLEKQADSTKV